MMKYQEPEMEVIESGTVDTIIDSTLYTPGTDDNAGGNEGGLGWDEL